MMESTNNMVRVNDVILLYLPVVFPNKFQLEKTSQLTTDESQPLKTSWLQKQNSTMAESKKD